MHDDLPKVIMTDPVKNHFAKSCRASPGLSHLHLNRIVRIYLHGLIYDKSPMFADIISQACACALITSSVETQIYIVYLLPVTPILYRSAPAAVRIEFQGVYESH